MKFITGNKHKFEEIKLHIPDIEQLEVDLPEIQELDSKKIIAAKLHEAQKHHAGEYIVEDVSLNFECFNYQFPGPLIKWLLKSIGLEGIAEMASKLEKTGVEASVIIGHINATGAIHFFEGECKGTLVPPRGSQEFGWSAIFLPEGYEKTFGEMTVEERTKISMRGIAAEKLKEYINEQREPLL